MFNFFKRPNLAVAIDDPLTSEELLTQIRNRDRHYRSALLAFAVIFIVLGFGLAIGDYLVLQQLKTNQQTAQHNAAVRLQQIQEGQVCIGKFFAQTNRTNLVIDQLDQCIIKNSDNGQVTASAFTPDFAPSSTAPTPGQTTNTNNPTNTNVSGGAPVATNPNTNSPQPNPGQGGATSTITRVVGDVQGAICSLTFNLLSCK